MSYVLKRDPAWLESLPIYSTWDALADLMGESGHVSVPATLLLAVSPLLRSMMTDILHPMYSPLVILLPGVEEDVLQVLVELLLKGTSEMNEDMQMKIRQVFDILSIGDSFSLQTECDRNVENEVDDLECGHQDSKVKLEIHVKLEQEEECQDIDVLNSENERGSTTVNEMLVERSSEFVLKGLDEDKQQVAKNSASFLNGSCLKPADWESRVGQSKRKELQQRKKSLKEDRVKSFNCQECEYQCRYKSYLVEHIRKHTGEKPFKCCLCEFKTGKNSNLRRHNLRHHAEVKNYKCENCEFKTALKSDLKKHQRIHSGAKPFSCNKCAFATRSQAHLTRHQITHSGAKAFNLDRCEYKSNKSKDHLLNHMKTHRREKLCEGSKV